MIEFLDEAMSMVCTISRITKNVHMQSSVSSSFTSKCFAYSGNYYADVLGIKQVYPFEWSVLLPADLVSSVAAGDRISNIEDSLGNVIMETGIIKKLDKYVHWEEGFQFMVAGVDRT